MEMCRGVFVRGGRFRIHTLTREDLDAKETLASQGIRLVEWEFEVENLDAAEAKAIKDMTKYNANSQDAMRYIYVADNHGRVRDIFDRG